MAEEIDFEKINFAEKPAVDIIPGLDELETFYITLLQKAKEVGDEILRRRDAMVKAFDEGGKKPWEDPYTENVPDEKIDYHEVGFDGTLSKVPVDDHSESD
mgnify:CR=1 FL=1